jgi:type II secretory pathway pseudopilin PulG
MSAGKALGRARRQRGAGYLVVLFALAAMGLTLAGAGQVWATAAQREREAQLLFVGHQFRLALASYRDATPVGQPDAPLTLQELVEDRRFPVPRRHLRRLWRDPFTNRADWALVKVGDRIHGVHSRVDREPVRTAFDARDAALVGKNSYAQWVFEALAVSAPSTAAP